MDEQAHFLYNADVDMEFIRIAGFDPSGPKRGRGP